eukprot:TRINITY_DN8212_c0_g1_i2.p1 TRINITY_DN8212_c0_g1~~TRINITY_DN8212_c0_g1_i2.p1  ORF type:complete len:613 (-),score=79.70 TRINITY_DN8212_c0_g1_i2:79-1869(-)
MEKRLSLFVLFIFFCFLPFFVSSKKLYSPKESVTIHVNKVGPYSNPSESYDYYSLPVCRPAKLERISQNLGEKIEGDKTYNTPYEIPFKVNIQNKELCVKNYTREETIKLKKAIENEYYYELELDGVPIRGFLGPVEIQVTPVGEHIRHVFLYLNMHFTILYNEEGPDSKGVVIYANVTSDLDHLKELKDNQEYPVQVQFTYSVSWYPTAIKYEDRMAFWHDSFFAKTSDLEIHWLSILNSFVLVILLTSFLALIIMRILKSDYSRYEKEAEADQEDYGWKLVHGDVFRFPPYKSLFCSVVGVGAQFIMMTIFILCLALVGLYYPGNEGNLQTSAIVLYALTAGISGFVSNYFYKQMLGVHWTWNVILTATIYGVPCFIVAFVINMVAVSWQVTQALPVGVILQVMSIWLFVGFPLTLIGGITGKRVAGPFHAPVRTKNFPREIPPVTWYRTLPFQMSMAGFLPFSAIYIELYYVFNSVWGQSSYQLWGILCLVFIILFIVTACITVSITYFQLANEDYRWWWNSFLCGGSTGLLIYTYSIYYYVMRSPMTGFFQAAFYFGYMSLISYFFFVMLGTVGFYSSLVFVRKIFKNLHVD